MAKITLVTGGCRSGKSTFAEKLLLQKSGPHVYIATCPNIDDEMDDRISKHQQRRESFGWDTVEEEVDLTRMVYQHNGSSILVECITLWVNNLLYKSEQAGELLTESEMVKFTKELLSMVQKVEGEVVFVTNETGLGVMPDNALARRYTDLCGRCNQMIATVADDVYFMVSGISQKIK
ncbi:MAG: bifunctional adenosylcobinamide kinase/adenosylcobinamide-phosphate guanylyltransferase [Lentisphaeraceae bacterium]|nr:bifunctional adenosylcobinamide kinase/adenosylcobinamide-phosphate guanylyltransferase [Lentisphaeraceae bacterium]